MNHIAPTHPPSEPLLLAELEQARIKIEIMERALEQIGNATDVPPVGRTWQERAQHFRRIAAAALTAAEGG